MTWHSVSGTTSSSLGLQTRADFLLSNNYINELITYEWDFRNEDVMANYVSFLKTISLKLNSRTIQFFFNEVRFPRSENILGADRGSQDEGHFPLVHRGDQVLRQQGIDGPGGGQDTDTERVPRLVLSGTLGWV